MAITVASGTSWTDILTAIGTVGAAVAAVGIAVWSHWLAVKVRERSEKREQLTSAYQVRVYQGERLADGEPDSRPSALVLVVSVCNRGPYTIKEVEVKFSPDGQSLIDPRSNVRMSSFMDLPAGLRKPGDTSEERAMAGVLTPWDTGMRSETDAVGVQQLKGHYGLVRWTDRWDQRWEHRCGEVRRIRDDERWVP